MSVKKHEIWFYVEKMSVAVKKLCYLSLLGSKKGEQKKLSKHEPAAAFINLLSSLSAGELACGGRQNKC